MSKTICQDVLVSPLIVVPRAWSVGTEENGADVRLTEISSPELKCNFWRVVFKFFFHYIWKVRKRLQGKKSEYDTVGEIIKGAEEAREYKADYFENLYQSREGNDKGRNGLKR